MARRRRNNNADKIGALRKKVDRAKDDMARIIATEALEHFNDSFQNQGFTDRALDPWQKRQKPAPRDSGRNLLVDSGALQNSLTVVRQQFNDIRVSAVGVPYARIHNEGGTIKVQVTPAMKRYFWAMWSKTGEEAYKYMALTKKSQFRIDIPQRKFMGNSKQMVTNINKAVRSHLNHLIRET